MKRALAIFRKKIIILVIVFFLIRSPITVYAHPGNTASDGCHYCRTNCAKWGEIEGERHCHNGGATTNANTFVEPRVNLPVPTSEPTMITHTHSPNQIPTSAPTLTAEASLEETNTSNNIEESESNTGGVETAGTLTLLGGVGYGGYKWLKAKNRIIKKE